MESITRALLVMDGNYVRKWYSYLAEDGIDGNCYSINFSALIDHISSVIEKDFGSRCVFTAKRLYMGTNSEVDVKNQSYYRALDEAGIQKNTFPLRGREQDGHSALKEEACDTTIVFNTAKEFYSATRENRFDTLVLFAGDGDLTPLVSGLQSEGVKVVVVYYDFRNFSYVTRASQKLLESADKVIDFGTFLTERVNKNIMAIFNPLECQPVEHYAMPGHKVVVVRKSLNPNLRLVNSFGVYTKEEISQAITSLSKADDGWTLVAPLGKYLEVTTHKTLPPGTKLKDLINRYSMDFETKDAPAYSVRLRR